HYMTLLLNILRAVYWFDPVVHFAFSELRSDMESACDSDVLAYIGHEQKRGYLTVILDMFSYDTEPILGMSQIRSKRMAKRRMKGAFMKSRTSPAFRAITLCIALIMSLCCFTTACQSAPEKDTPGIAAEQTADPSPKPTLIPDPSAQEPEVAAATYAFDRTDPKQAVAEFLTRYLDDMAHGNDDFGFDSSNNTMYDGLLQLQDSDESHKNIALLRQWINFTQVLRETTVPTMDRGKFQNLEVTEFGIVDQLSGSIMYEYLLKGYFKTTVMGTFIEAGLIKDGDKYVITYVDFPDSKEYQNFCADFIDYAERNDIKDYNKNAYIEYIRKQKQQAAERYPIAAPESDPSSGLTSSAIADIQSALKALGYLENPSGAYDSATRAAIEMFQEDNALPSDGIAGAETLALLLSDSAKKGRLQSNYTGDKRIWREPPKDGSDGWSSMTANKITAYCGNSVTSTGTECSLGTAAVNPNAIPIGTELYIPGYGYAMAADVNAYKNKTNQPNGEPLNVIDLWFADKEDANSWGSKHDFTILYRSADAQPAREAPTADAIVAVAKKQVGKKYVFEASGPDELDPSGLVYHVLNECGIATGRKDCAGYAQNADWSKIESLGDVNAGDILFFYGEDGKIQHAGIYVGDGMMIDASSSYGKVVKRSCNTGYWNRHFAFARRVLSK
ncbi:MAG: NlpC/P60 family protein, partial [Clostridiales bacterium]|nr:NlpC/P60 family protein [Clostridiales bacterium]